MSLDVLAPPRTVMDEMLDTGEEHEASYISYAEFAQHYTDRHAEWELGKVILIVTNRQHQKLLSFLNRLLEHYLALYPIGEVSLAGYQMFLGPDLPAREPDLMVVLNQNRERIQETRLEGPCDIAIEIVSPESDKRDYGAKFAEYQAAHVTEYWLIDPQRRIMDVHRLGEDGLYTRLGVDDAGRVVSSLLPHFALNPALLWLDPLPTGLDLVALVQGMGQG